MIRYHCIIIMSSQHVLVTGTGSSVNNDMWEQIILESTTWDMSPQIRKTVTRRFGGSQWKICRLPTEGVEKMITYLLYASMLVRNRWTTSGFFRFVQSVKSNCTKTEFTNASFEVLNGRIHYRNGALCRRLFVGTVGVEPTEASPPSWPSA